MLITVQTPIRNSQHITRFDIIFGLTLELNFANTANYEDMM
jgi:hypothetical protein